MTQIKVDVLNIIRQFDSTVEACNVYRVWERKDGTVELELKANGNSYFAWIEAGQLVVEDYESTKLKAEAAR